MHGLALNVCPNLDGFKQIVPCGIADRPVGRMSDWIPDIDPAQVRQTLALRFAQVFGLELIYKSEARDDLLQNHREI
jgi:lipoyl(octanoyl) transferase